ncbi:MAG: phosphate ABC transporter permease, partial [Haloarcula sp.]
WPLLAGVALVAFAGVPASLPRALPFALGIAVLAAQEGAQ